MPERQKLKKKKKKKEKEKKGMFPLEGSNNTV